MKKKSKILLVVSTLLILIAFTITPLNLNKVRVDSGFDSSYDSGGSSGGYSSGGSSSNNMPLSKKIMFYVIGIPLLIIIMLISVEVDNKFQLTNRRNTKRIKKLKLSKKKVELLNSMNITEFDLNFIQERYQDYVEIQEAWMNFDYNKLRKKTTDELYNEYEMQLETLKIKNQKNIMKDFEYIDGKIIDILQENKEDIIRIYLYVKTFDYIEENGKVVRGTDTEKMGLHYEITYIRKKKNNEIKKCPTCGAEIKTQGTTQCEYCKSTITTDNTNWIMSEKEVLWQD
ncbi:MAG: TIM44-like domain-containing protein [Bacilli bacterium]|nr:TIM44-like domain-containing protein [Bacilli bacterium]